MYFSDATVLGHGVEVFQLFFSPVFIVKPTIYFFKLDFERNPT